MRRYEKVLIISSNNPHYYWTLRPCLVYKTNHGNANSWEVEVYEVVWLAKSWEFALPRKFYFLQNGGS